MGYSTLGPTQPRSLDMIYHVWASEVVLERPNGMDESFDYMPSFTALGSHFKQG